MNTFDISTGEFVSAPEGYQPPPQDPRDYIGEIKQRRDVALAAGTSVNGISIQTDDISQQRITGAALAAMINPNATFNWKVAGGSFVTLDAPTVLALAQAVRVHVQACFDREAELLEELGAIEDPEQLDIDADWPGGAA